MSKKKGPEPSTFVVDSSVCVLVLTRLFHESLIYKEGNLQERQNLDLFEPASKPEHKIPLIVYIHGGAWTERDKCQYRHIGDYFARQGYACAVINYRLSQGSYDIPDELQVKHPAHTLDCGLALCWLADNASHYSYDKDHIYIVGHSAGAFMASLLTLQPQLYLPASRPSFTVRGVIGVEGIYDLNQMLADFPNYLQWVVAPAFDGAADEFAQASPTVIAKASKRSKESEYPHFYIIHSEKDELVNTAQSVAFVEAMKGTWGKTDLFITNHPYGFHNAIVDSIKDGFDIIAGAILDFVNKTEHK